MTSKYYPETNEGRLEWWQNILTPEAAAAFAAVDFDAAKVTTITNDATWAAYCFGPVKSAYENYSPQVTAYINTIAAGLGGTTGAAVPVRPLPPTFPTAPTEVITCNFEKRREAWVQEVKSSPSYTLSIGETLRIEAPQTPFDPSTYKAELKKAHCSGPKTVSGKFRKARGNADGVILYGRKAGTTAWTMLGKFTATPLNALVPLAASEPEAWEFKIRAFKRDQEFGQESDVAEVLIKG